MPIAIFSNTQKEETYQHSKHAFRNTAHVNTVHANTAHVNTAHVMTEMHQIQVLIFKCNTPKTHFLSVITIKLINYVIS